MPLGPTIGFSPPLTGISGRDRLTPGVAAGRWRGRVGRHRGEGHGRHDGRTDDSDHPADLHYGTPFHVAGFAHRDSGFGTLAPGSSVPRVRRVRRVRLRITACGRQLMRCRTHQAHPPVTARASSTKSAVSIVWNVQNRLAGW